MVSTTYTTAVTIIRHTSKCQQTAACSLMMTCPTHWYGTYSSCTHSVTMAGSSSPRSYTLMVSQWHSRHPPPFIDNQVHEFKTWSWQTTTTRYNRDNLPSYNIDTPHSSCQGYISTQVYIAGTLQQLTAKYPDLSQSELGGGGGCKIYSWEPPFTPPDPANFFFQYK
jgi:hypothetical protein